MKIKREVNGETVEFELTKDEMWKAYDECEHIIDVETVDFYAEDDEIPDDKIDDVANRYRNLYGRYLEEDTDVRYDCVRDAIREVLGNDD